MPAPERPDLFGINLCDPHYNRILEILADVGDEEKNAGYVSLVAASMAVNEGYCDVDRCACQA